MNRLTPCLLLSTLLIGTNYGADWTITGRETKAINNQTINGVDLMKQGNLTVNSQGNSQIKAMSMFFLENGAQATFNVQSGTLQLDLGLVNAQNIKNTINFNVQGNSTLTLTNGQNGKPLGIFQGNATTLTANITGNSTLKGHLSNNGTTKIQITQNSKMEGDIRQNGGTLDATLEGKLTGNVILTSNTQKASLWANKTTNVQAISTTITGDIIQESRRLEGIMKGVALEGNFTQTGGVSDIAFHHSKFNNTTTLAGGEALLHFYATEIQSITSTSGRNVINLKGDINTGALGSHMKDYTGINSQTTLELIQNSSMQSATQKGGSLTIDAKNSQIKGSITGDNATLKVILADSKVSGSISNSRATTTISANASTIDGNITQNQGTLSASLNGTTLKGGITQIEGTLLNLSAFNSTIEQGIFLSKIASGNANPSISLTGSKVNNGLFIENLKSALKISMNASTIKGGYQQTGQDAVFINGSNSKIFGGIQVKNGNANNYMTSIELSNNSQIQGGIISNNHSIKVVLGGNSTSQDRINLTGGKGYFKASNSSTFTGDLTSQNTTETQLHLNANSKLIGNVTQDKGSQQIHLDGGSVITGSITNNEVNSTIGLQTRSKLEGNLTQNKGTLNLGIGSDATIVGNVELNEAQTILNNGQTNVPRANINGNLTQNKGTLTGSIGGLILKGVFTQNEGTSNITFSNATFHNPTTINKATLSKVFFNNNSTLKDYTIIDSNNDQNLLQLNNQTTLDGNFTLKQSSAILQVWNQSKITGNVISKDAGNKLKVDFQNGGSIGGNLEISKGDISGTINSGTIGGDIKLTDATSKLNFFDSKINGNIHIIRGSNEISLSSTAVGGWFKMEGVGPNDPTLKLKISNKSSIAGDLTFLDTKAYLGGDGLGNVIKGSLISKNSTLLNGASAGGWQAISGLTIQQDFKQEGGKLDLVMQNQSHIQGKTEIENPDQFHLKLQNKSTMGEFAIKGGMDNELTFSNQSKQNGPITLTDTKITIKALQNSSITSNISVVSNNNFASKTSIFLDQSTLTGNLTQNSGSLLLQYSNQSKMTGNLVLSNLDPANIKLDRSEIVGAISLLKSKASFELNNQSQIQTDLTSTNSEITLEADNSTLKGSIQHTGDFQAQDFELKLSFKNGAKLENTKTNLVGTMKITANDSVINSEEINLILGKLDITMDHSSGTIKHIQTAGDNKISISTSNQSKSEITKLEIKDSANLSLVAQSEASISGQLFIHNKATANIQSLQNALVGFDIALADQANLDITLGGGKLQGKITQQGGPLLGKATLGSVGNFGGRWIMTESSSLNSLTINNSQANVGDKALMLMGVENSPISMVDMTKDPLGASRIGLEITLGNPQNNQTTARVLSLSNLNGQNGVFRVYTDLGTGLSDSITTKTATGSHIVQVYYNPATFTKDLTGKHIVIAHVDDSQTTANFVGGLTEIGNQAFQSNLVKVNAMGGNGFDWILGGAQQAGPSYGTKVIASILQSQYRAFAIQTETLNQRLGDLKNINRISGVWARHMIGSNQTKETQTHIKVQDRFYSTWIGYDENSINLRGQNFFGFALSHTLVSPDSPEYTGDIHNIGFNFYNVFLANNDFYFDIVAKYILSHGSYDINYVSLAKNAPKYFNHKFMISLEIGKKFKLTEGEFGFFYIQPEGQVTSGYLHGNALQFTDLSNTTINASIDYTFPVLIRAGLVGAYALEYSSFKADFRFGTSLIYEVKTGGKVKLDDGNSLVEYKYTKDFHLLFQAGTNITINEFSKIYLEASTGFLGITSTAYAFNAGVRFTFGPKNTRRLKIPAISTPPPPPKPEVDPRNIPTITDNTKQDIKNNQQLQTQPQTNSDYFINTRKNYRDRTSLKQ